MRFFAQLLLDFTAKNTSPVQLVIDTVIILLLLLIASTVLQTIRMIGRLIWGDIVRAVRWRTHHASFSAQHLNGKRILILGDSTAFGMGADRPEDTIAGRFGHDFPNTEIVNLGVNGAVTSEVLRQAYTVRGQHFDLVLLFTGGNDIWRFTRLSALERSLTTLIKETGVVSDQKVIVLFYANFGLSPLFPLFIRRTLVWRMLKVREIFLRVCKQLDVAYIELYVESDQQNPFKEDPRRYFSYDYTHPSSEGYRLWYNRMWREMLARGYSFEDMRPTNTNPPNLPPSDDPLIHSK